MTATRLLLAGYEGEPEAFFAMPKDGRRLLVAFWHGDSFYLAQDIPQITKYHRHHIMASKSRDGDLMARYLRLAGATVVRGSSSRGGGKALLGMIRAMGADPVQKLVLPRVLAATLGLPMLTAIANVLGMFGGLVIGAQAGITPNFYYQSILKVVSVGNVLNGLGKTFVFGFLIAMVACHMGLRTRGGTVGVGLSTTRAVVVSSISVLVSDFFLTKIILMF